MNIDLQRKEIHGLLPTDILFQTAYWSQVKSLLGWKPAVFDFKSSMGQRGDLLALIRPLSNDLAFAYVPQGPESGPDSEQYGLFLEALSEALAGHLDPAVVFIRYDLPWESPYPADAANGQSGSGRPVPQLRELRLNIGTRNWNLRKAAPLPLLPGALARVAAQSVRLSQHWSWSLASNFLNAGRIEVD